ncbi:MAG: AI-2E family transporter [Lachnospiraceae bacterium]|nr:AI-2E family transporter [Lachnospiraceae bacterium]
MKIQLNNKYIRIGITAFAVIAASICFYYLVFHGDRFSAQVNALFKVISPVMYGIIFAYLMTPMINGIEGRILTPIFTLNGKGPVSDKQKKYMRMLSIILTLLIVGFLINGFFSILIPNIIKSIRSISYQFPYYIQNLTNWSAKFLEDNPDIEKIVIQFLDTYSEEFMSYLNNNLVPQMETLVKQVSLSLISVLKVLWNFIIGIIISVYVLYSKETFAGQAKKLVFAFFQTKTANQFIKDVRFASDTFIGFISGKIIDSVIIGFICFAGTSLMQTPYALLVSVIVGVTNVIPFFGPYLGAVPSAILILMVNPLKCVYFIIFILILQQVDGNFIGPKILGQSTGLSGFWVIFSITIFGGIMGIPGMIIGVPFFAVLYALARRIINRMLKRKGLPLETEQYKNVEYIDDNALFVPQSVDKKSAFFRLGKKRPPQKADHYNDAPQNKDIEKKEREQ